MRFRVISIIAVAFTLLVSSLVFVSCDNKTDIELICDASVVVELNVLGDRNPDVQYVLPDPGMGDIEAVSLWNTLVLFFEYSNGNFITRVISRAEYDKALIHNSHRCFLLPILSGKITTIYAAAFGPEQSFEVAKFDDIYSVKNFKTLSLVSDFSTDEEREMYMLSLFSGIDKTGYTINPNSDNSDPHIVITLNRLVSKVDLQYDFIEGVENGAYISGSLDHLFFELPEYGCFFPFEIEPINQIGHYFYAIDVSSCRMNGRAYSYVFPFLDSYFDTRINFDVEYKVINSGVLSTKIVPYECLFTEDLMQGSWHKINLSISGNTVDYNGTRPWAIKLRKR